MNWLRRMVVRFGPARGEAKLDNVRQLPTYTPKDKLEELVLLQINNAELHKQLAELQLRNARLQAWVIIALGVFAAVVLAK